MQVLGIICRSNVGLWAADSLTTRFYQRYQLIRDFRTDAFSSPVAPTDSVAQNCRNVDLLDDPPATAMLTIGVVDSTCMASTGFRNRVDSLWRHERCHVARGVAVIALTITTDSLNALEGFVRTTQDAVRSKAISVLGDINDHSVDSVLVIDTGPFQKWPTYWGNKAVLTGGVVDTFWTRRPDSSQATIRPSSICP
jgi:hypothetical protein